MSKEQQHKALVERFFDCLSRGDVEGFVAMYHPEGTLWTSGNTLISGTFSRSQIASAGTAIYEAFPDGLEFTIQGMTAEDDRVAVEASSAGKHVSGETYTNLYHFLFEFREGQVYRLKEYMDTERVTDILCGGQRPS